MFAPIIPTGGIGGWQYVKRTYEQQLNLFSKSPQLERDIQYFAENISKVTSATDLTKDRRLLSVSLGAFGLQDDINNSFFVRKILEEGTTARDALANRFSDNRYKEFSKAFSLGPGEVRRTGDQSFASEIIASFRANSFEVAVGEQNGDLRTALFARRVLGDIVAPPQRPEQQIMLETVSGLVDELAEESSGDAEYFERNIGLIATVDEFVSDRRLLEYGLKAFGLGDEYEAIVSFQPAAPDDVNEAEERIKAVLSEGSIADIATANQLNDSRYVELSRAFGFGFAELLRTNDFGFAQEITDRFLATSVEVPPDLEFSEAIFVRNGRLVFDRVEERDVSNDTKWLTLMGEPPLRALFERALNLPSEFGQADIDQQLVVFKERARNEFGSDELSQFTDPAKVDDLIVKYLARAQIAEFNAATSSASIALVLLQS